MDLPEQALVALGFSAYEARAYVALLGAGNVNGYEIAKRSGIPRASVYEVLDRLLKRKAVTRSRDSGRGQFAAVPLDRLAESLAADHAASVDRATKLLAPLAAPTGVDPAWDIDNYDELIAATRDVLSSARTKVVLAMSPPEAGVLCDDAALALDRAANVTSICMASCSRPCGGCIGTIYRRNTPDDEADRRSLLVVADDRRAITGEIGADRTSAIHSTQPAVVGLARSFIRASIQSSIILAAE